MPHSLGTLIICAHKIRIGLFSLSHTHKEWIMQHTNNSVEGKVGA